MCLSEKRVDLVGVIERESKGYYRTQVIMNRITLSSDFFVSLAPCVTHAVASSFNQPQIGVPRRASMAGGTGRR